MDSILQETWKPICGYEGSYEVSNTGMVRSVGRTIFQKNRWGNIAPREMPGTVMSQTDNGGGYLIVCLRRSGAKKRNMYVHRLVASAFVERPQGKNVVNHKDFDARNNACNNLEWTTQEKNVRYSVRNMCKPRQRGKLSRTGEKYIYARGAMFRLCLPKRKERSFKTLADAIEAKRVILND